MEYVALRSLHVLHSCLHVAISQQNIAVQVNVIGRDGSAGPLGAISSQIVASG